MHVREVTELLCLIDLLESSEGAIPTYTVTRALYEVRNVVKKHELNEYLGRLIDCGYNPLKLQDPTSRIMMENIIQCL